MQAVSREEGWLTGSEPTLPRAPKRRTSHNLTPIYPTFVGLAGITLGTNCRFLGVDELEFAG